MLNSKMISKEGGFCIRPLSLSIVICSSQICSEAKIALQSIFGEVILLPSSKKLSKPVGSHPDMLIFDTGNELIMHADYYEENKELFTGLPRSVLVTDEKMGPDYPNDILFDALCIGGYLICNVPYTSRFLKEKYQAVNVRQGYARCGCVKLDEKSVICEDAGIAKTAGEHGIDTLLISSGHVLIKGYSCGFIGGACVNIDKNTVGFFGQIESHPDYLKMARFAADRGIKLISLYGGDLQDFGGAIVS